MSRFAAFLVLGIFALKMMTNDANTIVDSTDNKKIKVTLFYESYCPFSVKFVEEQLFPTMVRYHNYMELDLIPFGNCQTSREPDGKLDFKCQHGEKECYGNRVHACVIQQGKTKDALRTIITLACLMNYNYSHNEIQQCLAKSKFSWIRHKHCMQRDSEALEIAYGKRTYDNVPSVKYVPFLMFDDVYNKTIEHVAVSNMEQAICDLLGANQPDTCPNFNLL